MEIRNFSREDEEELSDLITSVYDESAIFTTFGSRPGRETIADLSRRKSTGIRGGYLVDLVATHEGRVIANCELVKRGDEEAVIGMIISKEHRRKGLGTRLIKKCVESARSLGVRTIYAEINRENRGAVFFFAKCGFKDRSGSADVKIMAKEIV
jgi:GNAT superfamily N-acetyltransferase